MIDSVDDLAKLQNKMKNKWLAEKICSYVVLGHNYVVWVCSLVKASSNIDRLLPFTPIP